jgi:hypothetical protein
MMREVQRKQVSPTHDEFTKSFMLVSCQRFGQNVCPVKVGVDLDDANETLTNLIMKMMIF